MKKTLFHVIIILICAVAFDAAWSLFATHALITKASPSRAAHAQLAQTQSTGPGSDGSDSGPLSNLPWCVKDISKVPAATVAADVSVSTVPPCQLVNLQEDPNGPPTDQNSYVYTYCHKNGYDGFASDINSVYCVKDGVKTDIQNNDQGLSPTGLCQSIVPEATSAKTFIRGWECD